MRDKSSLLSPRALLPNFSISLLSFLQNGAVLWKQKLYCSFIFNSLISSKDVIVTLFISNKRKDKLYSYYCLAVADAKRIYMCILPKRTSQVIIFLQASLRTLQGGCCLLNSVHVQAFHDKEHKTHS
jgi:hypothetical protein